LGRHSGFAEELLSLELLRLTRLLAPVLLFDELLGEEIVLQSNDDAELERLLADDLADHRVALLHLFELRELVLRFFHQRHYFLQLKQLL